MEENANRGSLHTLGIAGSVFFLLGTLFPALFALFLRPRQPPWESEDVFVEHYHVLQTLPFYFGFFLVGGSLLLLTAIYLLSQNKGPTLLAVLFATIGGAVVVLNYLVQTTYLPAVVAEYRPGQAAILQAFTMANPTSFAWAMEMWGYGFIGLATWLAAGFFRNEGIERAAKWLFILNGILSIGATLYTALDLGWVLTTSGYIGFGLWNVLYFVLAGVAIRVFLLRRREVDVAQR